MPTAQALGEIDFSKHFMFVSDLKTVLILKNFDWLPANLFLIQD